MASTPSEPVMPASPAPQARNGFGVASLTLALVGLVFTLVPLTGFIALILGIMAIVFGLVGWGRASKGIATNRKMNYFGTGIGVLTAVLGIVGTVLFFNAMSEFGRDMERLGAPRHEPGQPQPAQPVVPQEELDAEAVEPVPDAGESDGSVDQAPAAPAPQQPAAPPPASPPPAGPAPAAPAESDVVLEVTGTGEADVSYGVGGSFSTETVTLPWTYTATMDEFENASVTVLRMPDVDAYSQGTAPTGEVGCTITVDGEVVADELAQGSAANAMCSYPY